VKTIPNRPEVKPVACEVRWLHAIVSPCPEFPAGLPGMVYIESTTQRGPVGSVYLVSPHVDENGHVQGYRFTSSAGKVYDIDDVHGSCDCPDSQFRHRACKHVIALGKMPVPLVLPSYRSAAEASEHFTPLAVIGPDGEPDYAA
jgi:hypothetical protein